MKRGQLTSRSNIIEYEKDLIALLVLFIHFRSDGFEVYDGEAWSGKNTFRAEKDDSTSRSQQLRKYLL